MGAPEQSSAESEDAKTVEDPAPESGSDNGAWSAGRISAADADELASRFKASWEVDDDEPSAEIPPAGNGGATVEAGAWSAGVASEPAPAEAAPEPVATQPAPEPEPPRPKPVVHEPSVIVAPMDDLPVHASPTADTTGPSPAIPVTGSNRSLVLGGIGAVAVVLVIVVALATSGDSEPEAAWEDAPSTQAAAAPSGERELQPAATEGAAVENVQQAEAEPIAEEAAAAPTEAETAAAEPAPPAEPETAVLRIRTTPTNATLSVDGRRVDNPYRAEHPEGSSILVEAAANGYVTHTGTVTLDRDRSMNLRLDRAPRPRAEQPARPRPTAMRTTRPRPTQMRARTTATTSTPMRGAGFVTDNPY